MQRIIPQFRARWPNVTLSIHEESSAKLEELIIDQELDIAVLQDPSSLDALYTQPISTDRLGLIASVSTPVGNDHSPIRLHDLVDLPLVLPPVKDNIRRRLEKACFQHGLRLSPLLETRQPTVDAGDGSQRSRRYGAPQYHGPGRDWTREFSFFVTLFSL